jgi:anaerobic magnesium-protoporphyrin IX monomethyl ester cyclase
MNICLITPPSPFLLDERVFPALGILRVGAVLEAAGHKVDHLDLCGVTNSEQVLIDYQGATTFGITATTPQIPAAVRIGAVLREKGPVKTILGGPHPTLIHAAAKRGNERAQIALKYLLEHFDVVVAGDGEKAIFTALYSKGLVDADDPKGILWNTSKDFEASPWPARHLIDMDSYHYSIDGAKATSAIAQLGCPMHCKFCGGRNSPMLRQIRVRSSGSVVDEMLHLHNEYGISGIMHFQDELNISHKGVVDLMAKMQESGVDWKQRGFVKAELFNEEQAKSMYAAGFKWLLCGFESAHPRILKNIAKNATREDNTRMLRIAHDNGIKVKALMSAGHPAESEETINATRDWLLEEKPDDFDLTVITVYPGTPYFDESVCIGEPVYKFETNGDALYSENTDFHRDMQYYKGAPGEYKSYVWTDYISRERLCELRDEVEADVRAKLGIPYPASAAAINFEHSMSQHLPGTILRSSQLQTS